MRRSLLPLRGGRYIVPKGLRNEVPKKPRYVFRSEDTSMIEFAFRLSEDKVGEVLEFLRFRRFTAAYYAEGVLSGSQKGSIYIEREELSGYFALVEDGDFAICDSRYEPQPVVIRIRGESSYGQLDGSFSILEELRLRSDPLWGLTHDNILLREHTKKQLQTCDS